MATNSPTPLSGLARALIQKEKLTETQILDCASGLASNVPNSLIHEIIKRNLMSSTDLAYFAAETFGYPLVNLDAFDQTHIQREIIPPKFGAKYQIVALAKKGARIVLATADPTNLNALDELKFQTNNAQIDILITDATKLARLSDVVNESADDALKKMSGSDFDMNLLEGEVETEDDLGEPEQASQEDDAPIVKFIQKILIDAITDGASDIHFEPFEKFYRIRVRRDGILHEVAQPPISLREKIASRIKVISRLDISEKRIPQDGRMKLVLSKSRAIDFRVSTLPTMHGEKIVMRILDPSSATLGIDALGYDPDQKENLLSAIERPYGMVLVTGPTGSGKTVSLYTCLNILNKPGINISTAEDPAEINLPGINQVNVNDKVGLTFASALKAFLRQDPDIIMVGEIRDLETAEISIKAAQTGHMVLSTLHTNDAPTTLERLRNMGVAPFNIASSVILITAQRLARRLCKCKKPMDIPHEALLSAGFKEEELDGSWQTYGPGGCEICRGSGYKGRVGIYQVMPISEAIASIIMTGGNSIDIAKQAKIEKIKDLRESGLIKVKLGVTSLAEVLATTNE